LLLANDVVVRNTKERSTAMTNDQVGKNLEGMDELDFVGWNNADWKGVNRRTESRHTSMP
jgi:hypothetical protein